jgi:dihydroneopterin aldolase
MTEAQRPAAVPGDVHRLLVRDLVLDARIGIYHHEQAGKQRVRINLEVTVDRPPDPLSDDIRRVISYERFVDAARAVVAEGHVMLVETVAERLGARILQHRHVRAVRIRVEKLDVFADAESVGVEVEFVRG